MSSSVGQGPAGSPRRAFLRGTALGGGAVLAAALGDSLLKPAAATAGPGAAAIGPTFPDPRLRETRVLWQARTTRRMIALTFDDGPAPDYTAAVLDVLARRGVRATFNVVGQRARLAPDLLRREVAEGHELGNHTWRHADLARLSGAQVRAELTRTHELLIRLTGEPPRTLRPPYGNLSGEALVAAAELDYDVIGWSVKFHEDLYDAAGNVAYLGAHLAPGAVILAHDTGNPSRRTDVAALPGLVDSAREQGYEFLTVSELLAAPAAGR